jgi:hypothetical protein
MNDLLEAVELLEDPFEVNEPLPQCALLRDVDIAMLRALYEGDTARITAHRKAQAALRAKLK